LFSRALLSLFSRTQLPASAAVLDNPPNATNAMISFEFPEISNNRLKKSGGIGNINEPEKSLKTCWLHWFVQNFLYLSSKSVHYLL
jgi:hypothetical protein